MIQRPKEPVIDTCPTLADLGERGLLRRVSGWFARQEGSVALGIGDDAAEVRTRQKTVVTTDALIEGVHFRFDWTSPRDLGHKALAVNLSDIAAMGARPLAAFLSLSVPPTARLADLQAFFLGLRAESRLHNCPLAGGDLTRAPQWTIVVTVLGEPIAKSVIRRDAARPGDWIYVTGSPGESGAGLEALRQGLKAPALIRRHLRPSARLAEGAYVAKLKQIGAMMDLSDGLWDDAGKLAEASCMRLDLWRDALPVSTALRTFSRRLNRDPREWVLFGGEDYELLFTTRKPIDWPLGKLAPIHCVGRVEAGKGVRLLDENGKPLKVQDRTWQHF